MSTFRCMYDLQLRTTSVSGADVEVSGFYSGEYTWKIEDAKTKLHLEAPTQVNLYSPNFHVGSFTGLLHIRTTQEESKWHVSPFILMKHEDGGNVAAFGGCKFDLLDAEGGLLKTQKFGAHQWKKTEHWGFYKFVETDTVHNQGINTKGKDLYLRVQIHVKGVPVQNGEPTNAGTQLVKVLADFINTKTREAHAEEANDTAAQCMLPMSTSLDSAGTGTLSFVGGGVQIKMPLVATGEDKAQALQQHMACYQILLENPCKRFKMTPDLSFTDPSVAIDIAASLVGQCPLIQSLQEATVPEAVNPAKVARKGRTTSRKTNKKRKSAEMTAAQSSEASMDQNGSSYSVPLKPPASASGVACVLMLVEGAITPQKLFTCSCGPRLAVQTLWAASYLGHKLVEQVVTKWLHCVVLSMLAGDDVDASEAPEDVKEAVGLMRKSEEEWQQVFGLLPSDTLNTIFDDLMACESLQSKVLKLPIPIIDQWIASCNGVISLQSTTVPDVACVLKLIDRLPHHPEVQVLHIPKVEDSNSSAEDTVRVLEALDLVVPGMLKLRVLGTSNLRLTKKSMNEMLSILSILSVLRDRLQGFALPIGSIFERRQDRVEFARVLFRAVGKMSQLQTLRIDRWEEGITKEHVAGITPLKVLLPNLPSAACVDRMAVEAPGLKFCVASHC